MVEGNFASPKSMTFAWSRVVRKTWREKLHGNRAAQSNILSAVDNTHATAAQRFKDAIVGDGLSPYRTRPTDICQTAKRAIDFCAGCM